ncbi:hypothetical protein G5S52_02590 [Grimontia sp. S25]|uniref:DUF7684 domain-containing protein n=2 Tax=Grimontia sedimenti TaxID=2711294 RepID=A0A6M1R8W1_9GAMM|nr:hypothetical protein [Grimontia sedimenti]
MYDDQLISLINKGYELVCVVGQGCQHWEDVIDELAVGDGTDPKFIVTTSHPDESVEDVVEFAKALSTSVASDIDIVQI